MLIDSHAHLNFAAFKDDFDEVIKRCLENDIWVINVGTKYETSKKAVEIAQKYEKGIYASVGLHPVHLETGLVKIKNDTEEIELKTKEEDFDYEKYKELVLAGGPKVVAIGEVGLDYYYRPKTKRKLELFKEKQRATLCQQLNLAKELNLPVIFHCRVAHDDLLDILNSQFLIHNSKLRGVMHCFTGTLEQLQEYLEMGFYIGFNGIIFKKIEGIKVAETSSHLPPRATSSRSVFEENIKITPLDRILVETDCPYLAPPNFSEEKNNPLGVKYIVERIAEIKKIRYKGISEVTTENAKKLFNI